MNKKGVLIALGELFLKSERVRNVFKRRLERNIFLLCKKEGFSFNLLSFRERLFIEGDSKKIKKVVENIFGISWYSECVYFPHSSFKDFLKFIKENYKEWIKEKETFALRIKLEKNPKLETREEIINSTAKIIRRKVNLTKPKKEIFIERRRNGWFLFFKKRNGKRGLPVGVEGKVAILMSGGIDSPVASYLSMKRGAENIWIHFHSFPITSNKSIKKIEELSYLFLKYQPKIKVYFVPFHEIQSEIKLKIPPSYRVLLYRRIMLYFAEKIALKEGCEALVTGESLGQVSSQTLTNIGVTNNAVKMPIIRPLIGYDKEEIIDVAKKINSYNISIKPHEDCCTLFVPKHSSAKSKLEDIRKMEKKIIKKLPSYTIFPLNDV